MTAEGMDASPREVLASGALELGVRLTAAQLDKFDAFTEILIDWNSRFNLTRITDPMGIVIKHYLDSLTVLSVADIAGTMSVIDVGTGAGFPGIPLKIVYPELRVTLLDSVRKRLSFIDAAAKELGLGDVETLHARAEDAGQDRKRRGKYDFAVSRAVAKLNILTELCLPLCRVGGRFVAYKGPDVGQEIIEAVWAARDLGGIQESVRCLTLPHTDMQRTLIVVKKTRPTPAGYPRGAGIPAREPLV